MRKIDYLTLSQSFAEERARIMQTWFEDESERMRHLKTLRRVADRFARSAHVDHVAFLKACGFE